MKDNNIDNKLKNLFKIWLSTFIIGGVIYQGVSILDVVSSGTHSVSDALFKLHHYLWYASILLYYYPFLIKIHRLSKLSSLKKVEVATRILLLIFTAGIVMVAIVYLVQIIQLVM